MAVRQRKGRSEYVLDQDDLGMTITSSGAKKRDVVFCKA